MKLSLPNGHLVITGLFIRVNMALLMPFMPLHLHIREFHYFISRVAYEKVKWETEIVMCYMDCLEGSSSSCAVCGTVIQCAFTPFPCTTACLISCLTRITQQPLMRLNQRSELSLQLHQSVHILAVIWWKIIWKCFEDFKLIALLCAQICCLSVWGLLDVRVTWRLLQLRLQMAPFIQQWQCLLGMADHTVQTCSVAWTFPLSH